VAQRTNEMLNFEDYDSYDYHVRMSFFDKEERSLVFDILARIDADRLLGQELDTYDQMPERGAVKDGGYIPYDRNMPDLKIDDLNYLANSEEGRMIGNYWQNIIAPQNDNENPTGANEMELAEQLELFSNGKETESTIPESKRRKDLLVDDVTPLEAIEEFKKSGVNKPSRVLNAFWIMQSKKYPSTMTLVGDSTKIADTIEIDISDEMAELPFLRPEEIETIKRHKKLREERKKKLPPTPDGKSRKYKRHVNQVEKEVKQMEIQAEKKLLTKKTNYEKAGSILLECDIDLKKHPPKFDNIIDIQLADLTDQERYEEYLKLQAKARVSDEEFEIYIKTFHIDREIERDTIKREWIKEKKKELLIMRKGDTELQRQLLGIYHYDTDNEKNVDHYIGEKVLESGSYYKTTKEMQEGKITQRHDENDLYNRAPNFHHAQMEATMRWQEVGSSHLPAEEKKEYLDRIEDKMVDATDDYLRRIGHVDDEGNAVEIYEPKTLIDSVSDDDENANRRDDEDEEDDEEENEDEEEDEQEEQEEDSLENNQTETNLRIETNRIEATRIEKIIEQKLKWKLQIQLITFHLKKEKDLILKKELKNQFQKIHL